jgi:hypothetical protein
MGDAGLVHGSGAAAEVDGLVRHDVPNGVGLDDDDKRQIARGRQLLGVRPDKLVLIPVHAALGAVELAERLAAAAVAVREVVQHHADDLSDARLLLPGAGAGDSRVDGGQAGEVGDPDERGDVLDLADGAGDGGLAARAERVVRLL